MTAKPKRRWFQFSLRGLLATVLGSTFPLARIAYLHHLADFHQREAERLSALPTAGISVIDKFDALVSQIEHMQLADAYREATYRPWMVVDENACKIRKASKEDRGFVVDP